MVLTGFVWFAGLLSEATSAPLYTLGVAIEYVFLCGFIYIVLSFPSGQLRGRADKAIVAIAIAGTGSAGGRDAVRERLWAALRRGLRAQPDPGLPRQRAGAQPCSTCSELSAPF